MGFHLISSRLSVLLIIGLRGRFPPMVGNTKWFHDSATLTTKYIKCFLYSIIKKILPNVAEDLTLNIMWETEI